MKVLIVVEDGIVQQVYSEDHLELLVVDLDPESEEPINLDATITAEPLAAVFSYPRIADELLDCKEMEHVRKWVDKT